MWGCGRDSAAIRNSASSSHTPNFPSSHTMLVDHVARFIEGHGLLPEGARVLVGLSGGVDSVVLVHVLRRLGYAVRAMHVNYGLRGDASDGDEAFVRAWCEALGLPLEATRFDTRAEAAARGDLGGLRVDGRDLAEWRQRSQRALLWPVCSGRREKIQRRPIPYYRPMRRNSITCRRKSRNCGKAVNGSAGICTTTSFNRSTRLG